MKQFSRVIIVLAALALAGVLIALSRFAHFALLAPSGPIALAERALMIHAVLLMLVVVIPVMVLTILIAWHYREGNTKAVYHPNREHSTLEELVWWAVPLEIILVLSALTWTSSHQLDPAKALAIGGQPLVVEVVALDWKWLFIYPDEGVASVGTLVLPTNRQIEFRITADAPMNSFWIPDLGGQIYAMTGMVTTLHLAASKPGNYPGSSANYSGEGFAGMNFVAHAVVAADFGAWVAQTKTSSSTLDATEYKRLRDPQAPGAIVYYGSVQPNLFDAIVSQFMPNDMSSMHTH